MTEDMDRDSIEQRESEERQQTRQEIKRQLENMPRFNYKAIRFYRHKEEMEKAIDSLAERDIKKVTSRPLTENYIEELYQTYMILPGEYSKILKGALTGFILGAFLGLFHGAGIFTLAVLNPLSAGGAPVTTLTTAFSGAVIFMFFKAVLLIFKPVTGVTPGYYMLTVYGDYEDKKKIEAILKESVTVDI
jgi:hypothetical protein